MRIGIVGAENSHTAAIAKLINIDRRVRGVAVTHVWGETPGLARQAAQAGRIPTVVARPEQMIGQIDAAVVDHRHGREHLPAALPLLEARLPLFIDKPFCYRVAAGRRFLARAAELQVPVCSFSVLPHQDAFAQVRRQARALGRISAVATSGPCDVKSKYGGVFFYGIHQVDMVLRLVGYDVAWAQLVRGSGRNHVATLTWRDGAVASLLLLGEGHAGFALTAVGERGRVDRDIVFDDNPYLAGVQSFCRLFRTGRTDETAQTMLGPVAVLEALEKSLARGGRVRVTL